ncbi:hypothetical protein SK069_06640 [Patulibacter brassicae]|jgi:hypothetical protein|uniref:Family 43 glycosylhydrolase n=1 Tax=Patulibacter brassicae TaxID=1705717 RepID=A0ABU4VIK6_9ACTN|nr:hypothetical protein [Patulibacter brassicae]MDX8151260.1 hypothetical protein [Patulibacter brassicae]
MWRRILGMGLVLALAGCGGSGDDGRSAPWPAAEPYYLLPHFQTASRVLHLTGSSDGLRFPRAAGPRYAGLHGIVRDPSILHHGGRWWLAYTSGGPARRGGYADYAALAVSDDLRSWAHVARIPGPPGNDPRTPIVWAPEWFVDADGSVHLLLAAGPWASIHLWETRPVGDDWRAWSTPVPLARGLRRTMIDPFVLRQDDGRYHLFYKDQATGHIEHAIADELLGRWHRVPVADPDDWMPASASQIEGQSVVRVGERRWRIYFDAYRREGDDTQAMYWSETSDPTLETGWTLSQPIRGRGSIRHGTVLRLTDPAQIAQARAAVAP